MNFIQALLFAAAGCSIRRRDWPGSAWLYLKDSRFLIWDEGNAAAGYQSMILGPDEGVDLTEEDLKAEDWVYED